MEEVGISESLAAIYKISRHRIPHDRNHRQEYLKSNVHCICLTTFLRATYPAHLTIIDFIDVAIQCRAPYYTVFFIRLLQHQTASIYVYFFLRMRDKLTSPYKIAY